MRRRAFFFAIPVPSFYFFSVFFFQLFALMRRHLSGFLMSRCTELALPSKQSLSFHDLMIAVVTFV